MLVPAAVTPVVDCLLQASAARIMRAALALSQGMLRTVTVGCIAPMPMACQGPYEHKITLTTSAEYVTVSLSCMCKALFDLYVVCRMLATTGNLTCLDLQSRRRGPHYLC